MVKMLKIGYFMTTLTLDIPVVMMMVLELIFLLIVEILGILFMELLVQTYKLFLILEMLGHLLAEVG